ncbi:hypothetical protein MPTK1_1g15700 [Marchantia polymorpha subsp. ruderalis]|uniref:Uncharacterized protein n=2 Tax=Marchantia polymorpha TaxID=3197 RepID=A0AAF6AQJ8_MARPO|nr:hypothetical protein MARPO_0033s0091 [Marchantia polymorpha]BBM98718.1 hypothetical protein Mp_1g15700 [Marchantia polymorpha subsp. ruderalis]|eukprot:PTQ41688.1 hypothetical protein MARPO_0033s0091 [Marchantia polymorpha]
MERNLLQFVSMARKVFDKAPVLHQQGRREFHYSNDYIHAPTMYNITAIKNRKLKFGVAVFGGVAVGIIVPMYAYCLQQNRAKGPQPEPEEEPEED